MAFDIIVFNQKELDRAVKNGERSVCLCDNKFKLPYTYGMTYYATGDVAAKIQMTQNQAIQNNVVFYNFIPKFQKRNKRAKQKRAATFVGSSFGSGSCGGRSSKYNLDKKVIDVYGYGVNLI